MKIPETPWYGVHLVPCSLLLLKSSTNYQPGMKDRRVAYLCFVGDLGTYFEHLYFGSHSFTFSRPASVDYLLTAYERAVDTGRCDLDLSERFIVSWSTDS